MRQFPDQLRLAAPNTPFYDARPAGQTDAAQVASTLETTSLYSAAPCNSRQSRRSPPTGEVFPVDRLSPEPEVTAEFNDRAECRGHLGITCASQLASTNFEGKMPATKNQAGRFAAPFREGIRTVGKLRPDSGTQPVRPRQTPKTPVVACPAIPISMSNLSLTGKLAGFPLS